MASDKQQNGKNGAEGSKKSSEDSGLGNLPPLSDFDSGGFQSDSNLPPLGSLDSDSGKGSAGGLPPISDLSVETPKPTGGNIKAAPVGFQMADADFESPVFDTPGQKPRKARAGFQDPAADSDFSPETPEIGPGPDSDMDTPMFDSAFGGVGGGGGGFAPAFDTPAPTQAMETPMFPGQRSARPVEAPAFDEGAFMPGGGGFEPSGTPAPDFSPDTAIGGRAPQQMPLPEAPVEKKKKAASGGPGTLITVLAAVICLVVGIIAGPFASTKVQYIPNPLRQVIADKEGEIGKLNDTIKRMQASKPEGEAGPVSVEEINKLLSQKEALTGEITALTGNKQQTQTDLDKTTADLAQVRNDLEAKNEEFVKTQDAFEDLQNQTAIVQARQAGLLAEVERLTGLIGTMDEASDRTRATRETLKSDVERLAIQIKEGIPLTPEKFAHEKRVNDIEDLKAKLNDAKWVTPELLDSYTGLYQKELDIAASTAYFFAKIPVTNGIGIPENKWAECLMKGNWAVYYRSLDGKNIGSYESTAAPGATPEYKFREELPGPIKKQIEAEVMTARTPGFEEKLRALAEKQVITDGNNTSWQRTFNSL